MSKFSYKKILSVLYIIAFMIIILMPIIQMNLHIVNEGKGTENRSKAAKPEITLTKPIVEQIKAYETYFNDNFGFRDRFIKMTNTIDVNVFKKSTNSKVILGKDNYLFTREEMNDYNNIPTLSQEQVENIVISMKMFQDQLEKRGISFVFSIAPNKSSIYPEYVADRPINSVGDNNYSFFIKALDKYKVNYIDLKKLLLENKSKYDLYLKRDTHWNNIAAGLVTDNILKYYDKKFNIGTDLNITNIKSINGNGDLDGMLGINSNIKELDCNFNIKNTSKKLPKMVMYHDSFGNTMIPLINNYTSLFYDYHITNNPMATNFPSISDDTKIVYFEIVERYLINLYNYDFNVFDDELDNISTQYKEIRLMLNNDKRITYKDSYNFDNKDNDTKIISNGENPEIDFNIPLENTEYIELKLSKIKEYSNIKIYYSDNNGVFNDKNYIIVKLNPMKTNYLIKEDENVKRAKRFKIVMDNRSNSELNIDKLSILSK
ncbi:alginate O-acetyltransferase AlgX-related protein [Clostridium fungisolvens]|uniref:AlgX/AlgJ SGNH hydrolase-like domain-containing protein n=1 Tax=Clostridium fungisolvens TaxID=1604897 RepID=A0A6V8SAI3_9CLOT|nr:hypothetical protein [Clostridium fungisolvens]GFP74267.1 hypothetical protein bsdtw1_00312 [Clostridium fungisolvens]